MQHFVALSHPARTTIDPEVVRHAGGEFASYLDSDSASPFLAGLRDALEAPLDPTQVVNAAIALSNVVALLALSLAESEEGAPDMVAGPMARSALAVFPDVFPADEPGLQTDARNWVCRVFGGIEPAELSDQVDGRLLAAVAALGDAGIMISDQVGLPRPVLAGAIGQAAAKM